MRLCASTARATRVTCILWAALGGTVRPATAVDELFVTSRELGGVLSVDLQTHVATRLALDVPSAESVACGPDGRIYLAQSGVHGGEPAIISFNRDGSAVRHELDFKRSPSLPGSPWGLSFSASGQLFFITQTSIGPHTGVWMLPRRGPRQRAIPPYTLAAGPIAFLSRGVYAGHLLTADNQRGSVMRRPPPFDAERPAVGFITGLGSWIGGIAISSSGEIFISESSSGSITRCDADGRSCAHFATTLFQVRAIAFDRDDTLYAPTFEGPVLRIRRDGLAEPLPGILVRGGTGAAVCAAQRSLNRRN